MHQLALTWFRISPPRLIAWGWVLVVLPLLLAACTGAPQLPPDGATPLGVPPGGVAATPTSAAAGGLTQVPPGEWGGDHLALSSTASGAHLKIDCDSGDITQPLTLDAAGAFDLMGTYTWCPAACFLNLPAHYTGHTDGTTLTLQIAWTDPSGNAKTGGPFQVTLGAPAKLTSECPK